MNHRLTMQVIIAGAGKLATELLNALKLDAPFQLIAWGQRGPGVDRAIVVHAGSGRELDDLAAFCTATHLPLIELSTR